MQHDYQTHGPGDRSGRVSRYVFLGFVAIALFLLITEHRAHSHDGEADPRHQAPPGAA